MVLDAFFTTVFFFVDDVHPALAVALIAFILTAITTFIYRLLTNQQKLKEVKEEMKGIQKELRELRKKGDTQRMMELQKQAMEKQMHSMKHTMVPTLVTLIPLLIIFSWVGKTFGAAEGANPALLHIPLLGWGLSWIWIYIIISIITSIGVRKIFKIY